MIWQLCADDFKQCWLIWVDLLYGCGRLPYNGSCSSGDLPLPISFTEKKEKKIVHFLCSTFEIIFFVNYILKMATIQTSSKTYFINHNVEPWMYKQNCKRTMWLYPCINKPFFGFREWKRRKITTLLKPHFSKFLEQSFLL